MAELRLRKGWTDQAKILALAGQSALTILYKSVGLKPGAVLLGPANRCCPADPRPTGAALIAKDLYDASSCANLISAHYVRPFALY